jgi:hypothetical protein
MELDRLVRTEWTDAHMLTGESLRWITEHADPGDTNPIVTAIVQLRAECPDPLRS